VGRISWRIVAPAAAVALLASPAGARGQSATAGIGLSDSVSALACTLAPSPGCPASNLSHALFDRFQALAADQTGGANAFRYVRTGIPWDTVDTGAAPIGSACQRERDPPEFYGTPWITLAERFVVAARRAGLDPLIAITTNSAARYPGSGNPADPANPSANQYRCGFEAVVSTLDAFAARQGVEPPSEYETYDEPDGARVSNSCNPTPDGNLPPHRADQCAAWYYYEATVANRRVFGGELTLVALAADGDSANDPNLVAIKAYSSYLTGTIGLFPSVWSFHPYEDLSAAGYLDGSGRAHGDTSRASAYIASLYPAGRPQPEIWLTEVAAQLTDPVGTYLGRAEGCDDGEPDDPPPYAMGACLDGNPRAQAYAASDFLDLARSGPAFPGQITRVYWHQFDSPAAHPTGWDSGLVAPGDRDERASYCVLSGESVPRALTDPTCNQIAAAEDSQDSADGYPESDAGPSGAAGAVDARSHAGRSASTEMTACPQPWCAFSLVRLRLSEIAAA
jgi:hypothetical protein